VIDDQDALPVNKRSQKPYEVQLYGVLTDHRHPAYALITNKKFWDRLAPGILKILEDAVAESIRHNNEIAQKENADALAAMKASGTSKLHEPHATEPAARKQALQPVYKAIGLRVPQELVTAIQKEVGSK
jgi:C4-dicarboxylate-binding protein DctP